MKGIFGWYNKNQGIVLFIELFIPLLFIVFGQKYTAIFILSAFALITLSWLIYKKILSRQKFKILKARYGSGNTFVDITSPLNQFIIDNKLEIPLTNGILGDPTPGILKIGYVDYQIGKHKREKKYKEKDLIILP